MVTDAENLRNWKKSYAEFFAACRAQFSFLKRLGFESEESVIPAAASATFTRAADGTSVAISSEYVGEPWVVVRNGTRGAGLHTFIARIDPEYRKTYPAEGLTHQLHYSAHFLKQHAAEVLPLRKVPPAKPRPRAGAGALHFLETELQWDWGRSTETGKVTVVFVKKPLRLTIDWAGRELQAVHLSARSKCVNLDTLVTAPASGAKQRLECYAAFLRGPGAALLAGKPSAWAKIKAR